VDFDINLNMDFRI